VQKLASIQSAKVYYKLANYSLTNFYLCLHVKFN